MFKGTLDEFVNINGTHVPVTGDWLAAYLSEIDAAKKKFAGKFRVLAGLEIGYEPDYEQLIRDRIKGYKFDFLLAAVHTLNHVFMDTERDYKRSFGNMTFEQMCGLYFRSIQQAAESKLFDAIAHLDVYKRLGFKQYGDEVFDIIPELMEQSMKTIVKNGCMLEINCSGYRHGLNEPYPSEKLLAIAKDCGMSCVTTGSDTHKITQLGQNLDKANLLIDKFGFKRME
jgi:histidinol-phosphatase (PHP family)